MRSHSQSRERCGGCVGRGPSEHLNHFLVKQLQSGVASRSVIGVLLGPFAGTLNCPILVVLPVIRHSLVQRIIDVWRGHERLNREQNSLDLEGRRPLGLKDVKADSSCGAHEKKVLEL